MILRKGGVFVKASACLAVFVSLIVAIFAPSAFARNDLPPLYLTIVIHNEEDMGGGVIPKANIPDYDGDEALTHHFADVIIGGHIPYFGRIRMWNQSWVFGPPCEVAAFVQSLTQDAEGTHRCRRVAQYVCACEYRQSQLDLPLGGLSSHRSRQATAICWQASL